jgi:hypothetical protein
VNRAKAGYTEKEDFLCHLQPGAAMSEAQRLDQSITRGFLFAIGLTAVTLVGEPGLKLSSLLLMASMMPLKMTVNSTTKI